MIEKNEGPLYVQSPHAEGEGSVAAGRDGQSRTENSATGDAQIAMADHGSSTATGKATARVEPAQPEVQRRQRLAAFVFFLILAAGIVLLLVGVKPAIAAIVIGGGGFLLNIYNLGRGS